MIEAVIVWTVDMALRLRHACFSVGISTFIDAPDMKEAKFQPL
jgi:hypothetical protein